MDSQKADRNVDEMPPQHRPQHYKFTPEEMRVIRECNRESFYQRCLPIGSIFGVSTYYGIKSGFLRPSARFGAAPKVVVSVIVGYFLGKLSYQSKCADKLMQLPNSQIGEALRRKRQGTFKESLEPGFGPGMALPPFSGISSSDSYSDLSPGPGNVDNDSNRPQNSGLDDSFRPSVDNPIYEEEMPPVQKRATTYDELRRKNREEYQHRRTTPAFRDDKPVAPLRPSDPPPPPLNDKGKNKYGDIWGE